MTIDPEARTRRAIASVYNVTFYDVWMYPDRVFINLPRVGYITRDEARRQIEAPSIH